MADRLMSAIEEIHLIELEQGWDDEAGCEMNHIVSVCSHDVVARLHASCTGKSFLMCANATAIKESRMAAGSRHNACGHPTSECWRIVPA